MVLERLAMSIPRCTISADFTTFTEFFLVGPDEFKLLVGVHFNSLNDVSNEGV